MKQWLMISWACKGWEYGMELGLGKGEMSGNIENIFEQERYGDEERYGMEES